MSLLLLLKWKLRVTNSLPMVGICLKYSDHQSEVTDEAMNKTQCLIF
jgi:hypothetical protein